MRKHQPKPQSKTNPKPSSSPTAMALSSSSSSSSSSAAMTVAATTTNNTINKIRKYNFTFFHGVIITTLIAITLVQLRDQTRVLDGCHPHLLSTEDSAVTTTPTTTTTKSKTKLRNNNNDNDNDDMIDDFLTTISSSTSSLSFDKAITNSKYYEKEEIRGALEQGNIFLGNYFFETPLTIDIIRKTSLPTSTSIQNIAKQNHILPLNDRQKYLLDHDKYEYDNENNESDNDNDNLVINYDLERYRCQRYGYQLDETRTKRRRIFYGATLADDSFFLLQTIATEGYDLYTAAVFIESNLTHTRSERTIRFGPNSDNLRLLSTMFGINTTVTVDYFIPVSKDILPDDIDRIGTTGNNFDWQSIQREAIVKRWKKLGMQPDDIGFLADADELFSRDYLRALQICDVPQLRPHQDCFNAKIIATTLIYESSPECIISNSKLWHPDAILGECLEGIGDANLHKLPVREFYGNHGVRQVGYGRHQQDYSKFMEEYNKDQAFAIKNAHGQIMYPLWSGQDFRNLEGGKQVEFHTINNNNNDKDALHLKHNGYHFHNFFESAEILRHKYMTYGEPIQIAATEPLSKIHEDVSIMVNCVHGWESKGNRKHYVGGDQEAFGSSSGSNGNETIHLVHGYPVSMKPIFFDNPEIRAYRHEQLIQTVIQDEAKFGAVNVSCLGISCKVID